MTASPLATATIREKFLQFFQSKGHQLVPSSPLVPKDDPTLLFCNSGMVQFKDVFLGFDKRPYQTAVTAQRCLRAGGKHNDLENVGYTGRHHTFFEMLGNFSFGDYFKEKAIPYAWEFLTAPQWLGIPQEHLWITVFGGGKIFGAQSAAVPSDDVAADLWRQTLSAAGFSAADIKKRITRIPTTDNFWMMGDTGPCGPCSEIFYDKDKTAAHFRGEDPAYGDDCVEIWNLVFMEFSRNTAGDLKKLPAPCVDTGLGLERISAVMQGVSDNYRIDMFDKILGAVNDAIRQVGGRDCGGDYSASHRVVADHIRAASFLVADGVLPDNEGRGYVLRKIIRRALIHGGKAAANRDFASKSKPWFCNLVMPLQKIMGGESGELLATNHKHIVHVLQQEERGFYQNYLKGRAHLEEKLKTLQAKANGGGAATLPFPGKEAFVLYDTYGFPLEATKDIINDSPHFDGVDIAAFDDCMAQQRTRSRAAMKFNIGKTVTDYDGAPTEFIGYEKLRDEATIVALFVDGEARQEISDGEKAVVVLDQTPFYAESGGQVGDSGRLLANGGGATVTDTQKIRIDVQGHAVTVDAGAVLKVGDTTHCEVDQTRRQDIARNHSATHLMHAALHRILGTHARQKGSLVAPGYLRFDFSHNDAVSDDDLRNIEELVQERICQNDAVQTETLSYDDAIARGATALFGEKYGAKVRMVTMDSDYSMELCGGTHVSHTGNIGMFWIRNEGAIAAGVRRIEAVTASYALSAARDSSRQLQQLAAELKAPPAQVEEKVLQLMQTVKTLQKQAQQWQVKQAAARTESLLESAIKVGGGLLVAGEVEGGDINALRETAKALRGRLPKSAAVFLASSDGDKAVFVAHVAGMPWSAHEWIVTAAATAGAKGGGRGDYAQAGGGVAAKIPDALAAAKEFAKEKSAV